MRQRQLEVERVLVGVARDSSDKDLSGEAISWAGGIGDRAEPIARAGHQVGTPRREAADPSPKVFSNEVARAIGKLWRWDDKSRNSARSAIRWVARVGDSGAQTLSLVELTTGCGCDGRDLSSGR